MLFLVEILGMDAGHAIVRADNKEDAIDRAEEVLGNYHRLKITELQPDGPIEVIASFFAPYEEDRDFEGSIIWSFSRPHKRIPIIWWRLVLMRAKPLWKTKFSIPWSVLSSWINFQLGN